MRISRARAGAAAWLAAIGLLMLGAGTAQATVVTTGCVDANSCTLEELFAGGTLTINDKIFKDWGLELLLGGPDLSQIVVTPIYSNLNPGLTFTANGQLTVFGQSEIDLDFNFTVATLDGVPRIKDNSLKLVLFTFAKAQPCSIVGGRIRIEETIFDETLGFLDDKFVEADKLFEDFTLFDSVEFAPQRKIVVEKNISVEGDFPSDVVRLEVFTQRFSQVPEPASLTLLAAGLAGLSFIARRRKR